MKGHHFDFASFIAGLFIFSFLPINIDAASRLNVLFIVCDDLYNHLSISGYEHIKAPAFDALAASGMRFNRAYCQHPVCGPSRASLLSGRYPESTAKSISHTRRW